MKPEFARRGVKAIGLSVDPLVDHKAWVGDIAETQGHALDFPLIADADRKVFDLVIAPSLTNPEEIKKRFPKGYKAVTPIRDMRRPSATSLDACWLANAG